MPIKNNPYNMGLASLVSNVSHLYGNTATHLAKPADTSYIILDVENGTFRGKIDNFSSTTPSMVLNGGFDTTTDWVLGTGWTISGGTANKAAGTGGILSQVLLELKQYESYDVAFTVSGRTAGSVTSVVGGTSGTARSTNATFTETIVAGAGNTIAFSADATFDGKIDTVSIKRKTMVYASPAASLINAGSMKFRQDRPYILIAPLSGITLIGSSAADVLTYSWV